MVEDFITTGEAVALNMAARYGHKVRADLRGYFKQSNTSYVKRVGTILVDQRSGPTDRFRASAEKLAAQVATRPITISVKARNAGSAGTSVRRRNVARQSPGRTRI